MVFGFNTARNLPEESSSDSQWGPDVDVNQIRITWDADSLYVAVEAVISNNNTVILLDPIPGRGLVTMRGMNSWSRNITFRGAFAPDLFGATWDGNTAPHLVIHRSGLQVDDQQVGPLFRAAASFSQNQRRRAMELAIPWNTVFLGSEGLGTRDTVVPGIADTLRRFAPGTQLKVSALIVDNSDGNGSPDAAPDNTTGLSNDETREAVIDNYAVIDLDRNDDSGLGQGGPDGVADWDIEPRSRVSFRYAPPIQGIQFELGEVRLDRGAFAPTRGEDVGIEFDIGPRLDPGDSLNVQRTVTVFGDVFDLRGRHVRALFRENRPAIDASDPARDRWNGRDDAGDLVAAGVYIVRVGLERTRSRPVVVVR
jgi:hypothetical protein